MAEEVRQLTLCKGKHTYVFRWRIGDEAAAVAAIVEKARQRELDWFDAAVLAQQVRAALTNKSLAK